MSGNAIKMDSNHGLICHIISAKIYIYVIIFSLPKERRRNDINGVGYEICNL